MEDRKMVAKLLREDKKRYLVDAEDMDRVLDILEEWEENAREIAELDEAGPNMDELRACDLVLELIERLKRTQGRREDD